MLIDFRAEIAACKSRIPITSAGLTRDQAIQAGTALREGWDVLRSLQFNPKASILRYTEEGGKEHLGIAPEKTLVPNLENLDVYISRVSEREVIASKGVIELSDFLFILYEKVLETDEILYDGKSFRVIQLKFYDPNIGRSQVVGRAI